MTYFLPDMLALNHQNSQESTSGKDQNWGSYPKFQDFQCTERRFQDKEWSRWQKKEILPEELAQDSLHCRKVNLSAIQGNLPTTIIALDYYLSESFCLPFVFT